MFLATAPTQPLSGLILDTATELCQEKPRYLGDHSQTALAELSRCILPKFFSLLYAVNFYVLEQNTRTPNKKTTILVHISSTLPAQLEFKHEVKEKIFVSRCYSAGEYQCHGVIEGFCTLKVFAHAGDFVCLFAFVRDCTDK